MSRFFSNLFIVLVICLSLSVIPINTHILDLEIKINAPKLPKVAESVKKPVEVLFAILSATPANTQMTNPSHLDFEVSSQNIKGALENIKTSVNLEIVKDGTVVKTINLSKLKVIFEANPTDPTRGKVLLPITFKDLSLMSGKYTLVVKSTNENCATIDGKKYPVFYLDDKTYVKALSPGKSKLMTLFIADSADELLIPISRFTYTTKGLTRLSLSEMAKGPKIESGLHFVPSSLYGAKSTLRNGKVTIDFSSDLLSAAQLESASLPLSLQAMLNTEFSLDYIQSVTLTINGEALPNTVTSNALPAGFTVGQEIMKPTAAQLFTGYINNSAYVYLVPLDAGVTDATAMFGKLKSPVNKAVKSGAFVQPVPTEIGLIGQKLDAGTLTLDLSPEVLNAFNGNENYINLMLDAIGNSMTTLPDVQRVLLTSGGVPVQKIGNIAVPKYLVHKPYLNPEKYEPTSGGAKKGAETTVPTRPAIPKAPATSTAPATTTPPKAPVITP